MEKGNIHNKIKSFWINHNTTFVLVILLLVFSSYAIFLAVNLRTGIIPDETYRFEVSTYFAETWGIPKDVPVAYTAGDNLHRNPYFGYWLFGRVIRISQLLIPDATERQILVSLRIVNWLFSLGTLIFTYLFSKVLIHNKWWQLLPVFLLTNTLMFVFLSGGVNYDNPTNMACAASIYFLARVLNKERFLYNSLGWMISISIATLIKYSIVPLALLLGIVWLIYIFRNRPKIELIQLKEYKTGFILFLLIIFLGLNFSLYGVNLIRFQSLTPICRDTIPVEVCAASGFGRRRTEMALPEKLTVFAAFRQGYPEPVRYLFDVWIREMFNRIFGIMGHIVYFPIVVSYFLIAFYWMIFLGARYIRKPSFKIASLTGIFIFYALILFYMNYNSELIYGFYTFIALQGRYIFPVISIAFILHAYVLTKVTNKPIRLVTLIATILLFLYGGPIRFIWYYHDVFSDWFI